MDAFEPKICSHDNPDGDSDIKVILFFKLILK